MIEITAAVNHAIILMFIPDLLLHRQRKICCCSVYSEIAGIAPVQPDSVVATPPVARMVDNRHCQPNLPQVPLKEFGKPCTLQISHLQSDQ
jgi:hypothetical protein